MCEFLCSRRSETSTPKGRTESVECRAWPSYRREHPIEHTALGPAVQARIEGVPIAEALA